MKQRRRPSVVETPKEMTAMMQAVAVNPARVHTEWGAVQLQIAVRRCQDCKAVNTCRFWLGQALRNPRAFRDFCANAGLFERLRGERRRYPR